MDISLDGDALCLNYINTVHNRKEEPLPDRLIGFYDLTAWARKVELINARKEKLLDTLAAAHQKNADSFFNESIVLRELLYSIFSAISVESKVASTDVERFNQYLKAYSTRICITYAEEGFKETLDISADEFSQITAPIIKDAFDLLLSDKLSRVKACPNCGWLFLDKTRNGMRRWCSMKNCGSSIKALDWYHRHKHK